LFIISPSEIVLKVNGTLLIILSADKVITKFVPSPLSESNDWEVNVTSSPTTYPVPPCKVIVPKLSEVVKLAVICNPVPTPLEEKAVAFTTPPRRSNIETIKG
jgi:hypothetical protein